MMKADRQGRSLFTQTKVKHFVDFIAFQDQHTKGWRILDNCLFVHCPNNRYSKTTDHSTQHGQSKFVNNVQDQPNTV